MLALTGLWRLLAEPAAVAPVAMPTQVAPVAASAPTPQSTQPVEQPAKPISPAPAETAPPPAAAPVEPHPATPKATPTATPLLDRLLAESRPWLDSVAENRWFLQLYTTTDSEHPDRVEVFLRQAQNLGVETAQLRVYHASFGDISRYGVVYGDYASRKDAVKGLDVLPAELKRYRPYARQTIRLRLDSNTKSKS
jgi:septal ring-binding cell division protein DamX